MLLGVETGDGINSRVADELLLGDGQLVGAFLEGGLQLGFANLPAPHTEHIAGTDQEGRDEGEHIEHSPTPF